jgi:hypothetical protein
VGPFFRVALCLALPHLLACGASVATADRAPTSDAAPEAASTFGDAGAEDADPTPRIDDGGKDAGADSDVGAGDGSYSYSGYVNLARTLLVHPPAPYMPTVSERLTAQFFPRPTPYLLPSFASAVAVDGLAAFCGSHPVVGQCCYAPSSLIDPFGLDMTGEVNGGNIVSHDDGDGGLGSVSVSNPDVAVTASGWSGGDPLQIVANGGVVGSFAATLTAPPDVAGQSPTVFLPDGGVASVPRNQDLTITWTAGPVSTSAVVIAQDTPASASVVCLAEDNGSFTIPSALLGQLGAGDPGTIAISRYVEVVAQSASTRVAVVVETAAVGDVAYQ